MSDDASTPRTWHTAGDPVLRRRWPWFPVVVVALLAAVGGWTFTTVEQALKRETTEALRTLLDSDVEALELWIGARFSAAQILARHDAVARCSAALSAVHAERPGDPEALRRCAAQGDLREELRMQTMALGFEGFVLVDRDGLVLASARDELVGHPAPGGDADMAARVLQGATVISRPYLSHVALPDPSGELRFNQPTMFVATPVRGASGEILSALGLRLDPDTDFTRILSIARYGETGDTYAFDADATMISRSRFDDQLRQVGLLPDLDDAASILTVKLRDPGVNMIAGERPRVPRAQQPLTRMAASALKGEAGIDVDGYRDYRGVEVVGAWRWLHRYGFGVATEVSSAEAFSSLRLLRTRFFALFGLSVVFALAMVFESRLILVLRGRVRGALHEAQQLGQYTLEEKIGEGGMASVYRASHVLLRRPTAVKLLHPERMDEADLERFEREVQLTSQLTHPNTIAIYDFGRTPEGIFYYAMEYLDGLSMRQIVRCNGPMPEGRVIHALRQVCASLHEAHELGLIHRDVKPANIMLCRRGGQHDVAKVLDFGLVKVADQGDVSTLTSPTVVTGTPHYMSPEAVRSASDVDRRADIYALGAVGFYLLTGQELFDGASAAEVLSKHLSQDPETPSARRRRPVTPDLEAALMACLAKDPDARPATVADLSARLAACVDAGSWTEEAAAAWWRDNEAACRGPREAVLEPTTHSMTVAVRRRAGA